MELIDTGINWISWAGAAYVVGMTIFLVVNIAIGAVKSKSALWWFLIYSVVVIGMMLAGLKYLPTLVLAYSNEGIEAAEPEMARFTQNIGRIFNTATGLSAPESPPAPISPSPPPAPPAPALPAPAPPDQDPEAGGGIDPAPTDTPSPPISPSPPPSPTPSQAEYRATADARLATVTAASQPAPTYDILKPPTPIITR